MARPLRNVRVDDDLWESAQRAAEDDGTTVSAVVVDALRKYVGRHEKEQARRRAKIRATVAAPLTDEEVDRLLALFRG